MWWMVKCIKCIKLWQKYAPNLTFSQKNSGPALSGERYVCLSVCEVGGSRPHWKSLKLIARSPKAINLLPREHGEILEETKNLTKKTLLRLTLVRLFEETWEALIYRAHRAVIFAIAQLSCSNICRSVCPRDSNSWFFDFINHPPAAVTVWNDRLWQGAELVSDHAHQFQYCIGQQYWHSRRNRKQSMGAKQLPSIQQFCG